MSVRDSVPGGRVLLQRPVVRDYAPPVARRQERPWRRRLLGLVRFVGLAILGIIVAYVTASIADRSLADVSGPVEAAILAGVVAVLLFSRWLLTRDASAARSVGVTEGTLSGQDEVRAASWPPGKSAPTTTPTTMPTLSALPAVPSAWGAPAAPTALPTAPTPSTVPSARGASDAPEAPTVVPIASTVVPSAPPATAADKDPTPGPRARGTREHRSMRETTSALQGSGATSALAEYLDGRTELTNLIASVEARMPNDPEPSAQLDSVTDSESEHSQLSVAQSTKMLAQAVEQVARACELIAHACELFAERVESDRMERRTLADAVMMLAQQAMQPTSTPRLVNARPTRQRPILENDSTSVDLQAAAGDLGGVATRSP
jgi:hypothetical protein